MIPNDSKAKNPVDGDPANPYDSFLLSASAGSGKTYQLSQRFLHLVGAGALPEKILTVTFTKKAAGEMQARILESANKLLVCPKSSAAFAASMQDYYSNHPQRSQFPPPLSGAETATKILGQSQRLKITTIDSIFFEWLSKFSFETKGHENGRDFPLAFQIFEPFEHNQHIQTSWKAFCTYLDRNKDQENIKKLMAELPGQDIQGLKTRLLELTQFTSSLWHREFVSGESPWTPLPVPIGPDSEAELMGALHQELGELLGQIPKVDKRDRCLAALEESRAQGSLEPLSGAGVLTKDLRFNKVTLGKPLLASHGVQISALEHQIQNWLNRTKIIRLNAQGATFYQLFQLFRAHSDVIKEQQGKLDFNDLAIGCFQLFHGDLGIGARFLISESVHHMLLDEFQDTSRMQWDIFKTLVQDMFAGSGNLEGIPGPKPSLFVVGDAKQSIYGFREADPSIMHSLAEDFADSLTHVSMAASYRTSQVVLDGLNKIFPDSMEDFEPHRTAELGEAPVIPNVGSVELWPLCDVDEGADGEAQKIADHLKQLLESPESHPIYDKELGGFRPIRAGDCAILYRASTNADRYESCIRAHGIDTVRAEEKGFFGRQEISDFMATLHWLLFPSDTVSLCQILKSPFGGLTDLAFVGLLEKALGDQKRVTSQSLLKVLGETSESARALGAKLQELQRLVAHRTPVEIVWSVTQELKIWNAYDSGDSEQALSLRNLRKFIELVSGWQGRGKQSLAEILDHAKELAKDDELGFAAATTNAVRLMTVHKSKGLEFPMVILCDTGRPWAEIDPIWMRQTDQGQTQLNFIGRKSDHPKGSPAFDQMVEASKEIQLAEARRLLYVAITRAKQYVLVTGYKAKATRGLPESIPHSLLGKKWGAKENGTKMEAPLGREEVLKEPLDDSGHRPVALVTDQPGALSPWKLVSVTDLLHEAESPSRQMFSGIKEELRPYSSAIGDFVHKGLECHFSNRRFDGNQVWSRLMTQLTPNLKEPDQLVQEEALTHARSTLSKSLRSKVLSDLIPAGAKLHTELPIAFKQGDQLVRGQIDLLIETPTSWHVVDYKTSELANASPEDLNTFVQERGYDQQLQLYVQALKEMSHKQITASLYFSALDKTWELQKTRGHPTGSEFPSPSKSL
jgi:ATP-dependent helicase/nuclease subunit A